MNGESMRLNKYLAAAGLCSRRAADRLIEEGKVTVGGRIATLGTTVEAGDLVFVDGKEVAFNPQEKRAVYAYYKPVGVVCTEKDEHAELILTDEIKKLGIQERVTYAGRLDKDSEGLILLTGDGDLIQAMMKGANGHEKEYEVTIDKDLTMHFLSRMAAGVTLSELNVTTRPCKIKKTGDRSFNIILTQGLNRQIRRMCSELGYEVKTLKRIRVVNIKIDKLAPGQIRSLSDVEVEALKNKIYGK